MIIINKTFYFKNIYGVQFGKSSSRQSSESANEKSREQRKTKWPMPEQRSSLFYLDSQVKMQKKNTWLQEKQDGHRLR